MRLSEIVRRIILNDSVFNENNVTFTYTEPLSTIFKVSIYNPVEVFQLGRDAILKKKKSFYFIKNVCKKSSTPFNDILAFYFVVRYCLFYCAIYCSGIIYFYRKIMNFLYYLSRDLLRKRKILRIKKFNKKHIEKGFHLECPGENADLINGVILVCDRSCDYIRIGAVSPFPDNTTDSDVDEFLFLHKIKLNQSEIQNIFQNIGFLGYLHLFLLKKVVYGGW